MSTLKMNDRNVSLLAGVIIILLSIRGERLPVSGAFLLMHFQLPSL